MANPRTTKEQNQVRSGTVSDSQGERPPRVEVRSLHLPSHYSTMKQDRGRGTPKYPFLNAERKA